MIQIEVDEQLILQGQGEMGMNDCAPNRIERSRDNSEIYVQEHNNAMTGTALIDSQKNESLIFRCSVAH